MNNPALHQLIKSKIGPHWGLGEPHRELFMDARLGGLKTHVVASSCQKMPCRVLGVAFINHATKTTTQPFLFWMN